MSFHQRFRCLQNRHPWEGACLPDLTGASHENCHIVWALGDVSSGEWTVCELENRHLLDVKSSIWSRAMASIAMLDLPGKYPGIPIDTSSYPTAHCHHHHIAVSTKRWPSLFVPIRNNDDALRHNARFGMSSTSPFFIIILNGFVQKSRIFQNSKFYLDKFWRVIKKKTEICFAILVESHDTLPRFLRTNTRLRPL